MAGSIKPRYDFSGQNKRTEKGTYTWEKCIGQGACGDVWLAKRTKDSGSESEEFAIKTLPTKAEDRHPLLDGYTEDEVETNKRIREANDDSRKRYLLTSEESFTYKLPNVENVFWCLVFKLARGGDLYLKLKDTRYSEEDVAKLMRKLLHGIDYIHNVLQGVHFDIKTDNIMFYEDSSDPIIGDFANVIFLEPDEEMPLSATVKRQIPLYQAPELRDLSLTGLVSRKSDMFSLGMICIELLFGYHPFEYKHDIDKMNRAIAECNVDFSRFEKWSNITPTGQDFVKKLTCIDPKERWSVTQALGHEWFNGIGSRDTSPNFQNRVRELQKPSGKRQLYHVGFRKDPETGKRKIGMVKFEGFRRITKDRITDMSPRETRGSRANRPKEDKGDDGRATKDKKEDKKKGTKDTKKPVSRLAEALTHRKR